MIRVPPPPPPPPGRTVVDGQLPGLRAVLGVVAFAAIAAWLSPDLIALMRQRADQRIGERAYVSCDPPAELEQLHIIVTRNEGRIAASCMYVGSRGTYTRKSVRQEPAQ